MFICQYHTPHQHDQINNIGMFNQPVSVIYIHQTNNCFSRLVTGIMLIVSINKCNFSRATLCININPSCVYSTMYMSMFQSLIVSSSTTIFMATFNINCQHQPFQPTTVQTMLDIVCEQHKLTPFLLLCRYEESVQQAKGRAATDKGSPKAKSPGSPFFSFENRKSANF